MVCVRSLTIITAAFDHARSMGDTAIYVKTESNSTKKKRTVRARRPFAVSKKESIASHWKSLGQS